MNYKKFMVTICVAIVLVAAIGCDKVSASIFTVEKGDKYNVHMANFQETVMIFNNQELKTKQVMDMNLSMKIINVDKEKNVTIYYTYESIKNSVDSAGKQMSYDSTQDANNTILSSIYSGLIGKGFTVKLDDSGKVLEIQGLTDILGSIVDAVPGTEEQKQALKNALHQSFSNEALKSMIEQNMKYYPPENVKVGDSWEHQEQLTVMFPMEIHHKWTILNEKNGFLNMDVQSTITVDTQHNPVNIMGIQANMILNGEIVGNVNINKKNKLIQNGTFTQNMSGEMEFAAGKDGLQVIKLPMTITSTINCETTKQ